VTGDDRCTDRDPKRDRAFTLIELLIVITMIAILAGLLFPAFTAIQNQAKRVQAKNDVTQIVTAVNGYYTEYGKYPIDTTVKGTGDATYSTDNNSLFDVLRNMTGTTPGNALNPRGIVFIQPPISKVSNPAKAGLDSAGVWYDPWGSRYVIMIDGNYDNQLPNPYTQNAGPTTLATGVIAWSFGTDGQSGSVPGPAPDKNAGNAADDVISWQ